MRYAVLFGIVVVVLIFVSGCKEKFTPTITQGVYGRVMLQEGNCSIGSNKCKTNFGTRQVIILAPQSVEYTKTSAPDINGSQEISRTVSDKNGYFQINVPDGNYTIIVLTGFEVVYGYCDSYNNHWACPLTVNGLQERNIAIDYATH